MDMLTIEEVARELRVSPRTVRSYIASGRLAVFPVGGKGYRIKRDDLDAFVAQTIEEQAQRKGQRRKVMSTESMAHSQDEMVTVALPRALVEQLAEYDPKTADLLGIDGYVAAICREWHGEEVIRKTKARAEALFFSDAKEGEGDAEAEPQPYIFQVRNHHVESCGTPPHFDDPSGPYLSYYENQFGEQNIFVLGLPSLIDAISVHPYRLGPPESAASDYQRLRTLLVRYAPAGKTSLPIVCSEWGYSLTWVSAQQQAAYLARLSLINLMSNLSLTIWYNWQDGPDPKQRDDNFGLITFHSQPKPVYYAAQTLTQELTRFQYTDRLSLPSDADYALRFTNGRAGKQVVWTTGDVHSVTLPMTGTSVMVTSLTGEKRVLPVVNGQVTLELSGSPQYLAA